MTQQAQLMQLNSVVFSITSKQSSQVLVAKLSCNSQIKVRMSTHKELQGSRVALTQWWYLWGWQVCSQACSRCSASDHVHTVVLWLMDPAAWAWVGDGSTYKFLIPSPVHGEEVGFFIISQYCLWMWVLILSSISYWGRNNDSFLSIDKITIRLLFLIHREFCVSFTFP